MEFPEPNFRVTPYGDVDVDALERLRGSFNTGELLALVGRLDQLLPRLMPTGGIRNELLQLHRMAHTVANGAALTEPAGNLDLWEAAQALSEELGELADVLAQAAELLQPLIDLQPDQGT